MQKNYSRILALILSLMLIFSIAGCGSPTNGSLSQPNSDIVQPSNGQSDTILASKTEGSAPVSNPSKDQTKDLKVHFLDVGQADSIFIELPTGQTMLIDAGNNEDGSLVCGYIEDKGYSKIDYLIGTHPHEDHIGGLDDVIRAYDIGSIYMPKKEHTSKTFEDVLTAIKSRGLKVSTAKSGVTIFNSDNLSSSIVAPANSGYDELNDYSAIVLLKYGDTSFLFAGDAEKISETEVTEDIKADVLKVGHHGSSSSTSPTFLKKVSPKYAVISVGKDNSYGHPDSTILTRLKTYGAEVYRTDECGTVIFTSNGKDISVKKSISTPFSDSGSKPVEAYNKKEITPEQVAAIRKSPNVSVVEPSAQDNQTDTVYVTKTGSKYHRDGCRYLSKSKIPISLSDAEKSYSPCSVCSPPTLSSNASNSTVTPDKPKEATAPQKTETQEKETTVYITKTGSKYHRSGCQYLSKSKIAISLSDAKSGYGACSKCNPPQ